MHFEEKFTFSSTDEKENPIVDDSLLLTSSQLCDHVAFFCFAEWKHGHGPVSNKMLGKNQLLDYVQFLQKMSAF